MRKSLSEITIKKLQAQVENDNTEDAHYNADGILCDLLKKLGYKDVVEVFHEVSKWYS